MVLQEDHVGVRIVLLGLGDALALGLVEGDAAEALVGDAAEEPRRGLMRHLEPPALNHGEARGVGHVDVEDRLVARVRPVAGDVDVARRRLDLAFPFQHLPGAVDHQEVGRPHLAPVDAVGIDQVTLLAAGQRDREVVADALVELMFRGEAERGRPAPLHRVRGHRPQLVAVGVHGAGTDDVALRAASRQLSDLFLV